MNILHEDCDPTLAKDTKLPYNTYVVEYTKEDRIAYDIAMSSSSVEVFDSYYDKYKKDFKFLKQTSGRVNPKLWNQPKAKPPKKPKKS
jgi:hypothetical protein